MGFRSEDNEPCLPLPRTGSLTSIDNRGRCSVREYDRWDSVIERAGDAERATVCRARCAVKRSGVTEEDPGTGGRGPVGGDDGGGLHGGNGVAATDLGEHGDIGLEADQLGADASKDGLFRRPLDVRLVGVPGM